MSAYLKIVSIAVLLLLPLATCAAPAKPAVPYRLVLAVGKTGFPELTVTLENAGPHPVEFFINSLNPCLIVEYKAAGIPSSPTGWQRLKSNAELHRKPEEPGDTETFDILITVAPRKEYSRPLRLNGFPVAADGYYRLTAETGIPDTGELILRSNSIIVRRMSGDFGNSQAVQSSRRRPGI